MVTGLDDIMKIRRNTLLFILTCSLFLGIVAPSLFSDGMFADGVDNAVMSRNMANDLGHFWRPHFSDVILPEFYEHPPLVIGIQSLWFHVFGDSIYVERLYSLTTFVIVGILMVLIWREITADIKTGWLPLLFWIAVPKITWACANNMLENTMSVFVTAAALFYLKSLKADRIPYIVLCGLSLTLGFLSKGFFALFVWSFPLFIWLFKKDAKVLNMIADTLLIIFFTALPIYGLLELYPDAANNLSNYFDRQILGRMLHVKAVNNRFYIIGKFINEIIPTLLIGLVIIIIAWRKSLDFRLLKNNLKETLVFFLLTLSGVIPIMVSLKQSSFYILAVYPFWALSLGCLLHPLVTKLVCSIATNSKWYRGLVYVAGCLFVASLGISLSQIDRIGRDHDEIADCYLVVAEVGKDKTVNICSVMFEDWSLHSYYARYGNISLDPDNKFNYDYYLTRNECDRSIIKGRYEQVPLKTKAYRLYKKQPTPLMIRTDPSTEEK
jgi:4-amino-4-deoxy-L-arabinose transferase-like glycosyltransferase